MNSDTDRQDLLLVCSAGGHLAQLMAVRSWWSRHDRRWVTADLPDVRARLQGEDVIFAHFPTTRNVLNLLRNFAVAFRVLRERRPDVIVSDGAAVAVPFFVIGWLIGVPTVYIEGFDRIDTASVTGRICYHLTKNFCVQSDGQLAVYPKATVIGPML